MAILLHAAHLTSRSAIAALLFLFCPENANALDCNIPLTVALDIGHSPGASGTPSATGKTEYSFNRRFVLELQEAGLRYPSLKLKIINVEARDISLLDRTKIAKEQAADLFVSFHHDSTNEKYWRERVIGGVKATYSNAFKGFSIFVSPENIAYEQSLLFARLVGRRFKDDGMIQSLHHAEPIEGEGRTIIDWDLGVYDAPFAVLKNAASPSVLIELGVLIHPDEELLLEDPAYRRRMAGHVLSAMNEYCAASHAKEVPSKGSSSKP
jgi:N-acetylmuramoyl-L-alanine amidase